MLAVLGILTIISALSTKWLHGRGQIGHALVMAGLTGIGFGTLAFAYVMLDHIGAI